MIANMLVRLFIFIMYFAYFSFCLQITESIPRTNIINLINSKIHAEQCNISLDSLAFAACDRPSMNLNVTQSVFFRDEVYLCMGVYDVVQHICSLQKSNVNFTSRVQETYKEINGDNKPKIYDAKNICNRMKTIRFEAANPELDPWLSKLNNTLQNNCNSTCKNGHEVNELCIFLLWGNTIRTELKLEQENVADMNVNTSKLLKKANETVNSQPRVKNLRQPEVHPSPIVEGNNISINELDGSHNKPEEVASKRQEGSPLLDDPNYDLPPPEDPEMKFSDETKLATSVETSTKQPLATSSDEAVQHLDINKDVTNSEEHLKGDTSSATLPEAPTTTWKITSITKNEVELPDSVLPSMKRKHFDNAEDSHFFAYFMVVVTICIIAYLIYHNKHKLLALILEGRRRREMRRTTHGGYRKLDSSLEEAVTSTCSTSVTHVIY